MFMIIREPSAGPGTGAMSAPQERSAKQVQAAIKKKVEKQKKRTNEQGGGVGDIQSAARNQKSKQLSPMTAAEAAEAAEDSETLDEQLEELMEGPRRREKEKDKETESVDLLPIVDSVFGQCFPVSRQLSLLENC